jgi:alanine-glyoxylate transaminase / serine-glyoxylate transaminase / serine-pyruvate transaminase
MWLLAKSFFRRQLVQRQKLMIPGPVDVPDDILEMMSMPCMPHYGAQWLAIYEETISFLKQVFCTQNDVFMIPGAGSASLEAAVGSMVAAGEKALVLVNGFFSQRLGKIAQACGIETANVEAQWGKPILPEQLQKALEADGDIKAVIMVHNETSTGVLNPLKELVEITHRYDLPAIVDAISSVGGVPVPVDEWGIECCVTVANKCLETPPGLGIVSVSPHAWEVIASKADKTRGWYLNLNVWRDYSLDWDWHPYPTTLPTNNIVALHKSLQNLLQEGLEARYARYRAAARLVRDGLEEMDFGFLVSEAFASPLITATVGHPGVHINELITFLRDEHGILVGGGIGPLQGRLMRVGHMGQAISDEYGKAFLAAVQDFVAKVGDKKG